MFELQSEGGEIAVSRLKDAPPAVRPAPLPLTDWAAAAECSTAGTAAASSPPAGPHQAGDTAATQSNGSSPRLQRRPLSQQTNRIAF